MLGTQEDMWRVSAAAQTSSSSLPGGSCSQIARGGLGGRFAHSSGAITITHLTAPASLHLFNGGNDSKTDSPFSGRRNYRNTRVRTKRMMPKTRTPEWGAWTEPVHWPNVRKFDRVPRNRIKDSRVCTKKITSAFCFYFLIFCTCKPVGCIQH